MEITANMLADPPTGLTSIDEIISALSYPCRTITMVPYGENCCTKECYRKKGFAS
jgi:hypothetical protein